MHQIMSLQSAVPSNTLKGKCCKAKTPQSACFTVVRRKFQFIILNFKLDKIIIHIRPKTLALSDKFVKQKKTAGDRNFPLHSLNQRKTSGFPTAVFSHLQNYNYLFDKYSLIFFTSSSASVLWTAQASSILSPRLKGSLNNAYRFPEKIRKFPYHSPEHHR